MNADETKSLVPVRRAGTPSERKGVEVPAVVESLSRSLAQFSRNPIVRRAAVGLAFGIGMQLGRGLSRRNLAKSVKLVRVASRVLRDNEDAHETPVMFWMRRRTVRILMTRQHKSDVQ